MSLLSLMPHTAVIQRRSQVTNRLGGVRKEYEDKAAGVQCRLSNVSGRAAWTQTNEGTIKAEYNLYFPVGTDIEELDRVLNVRDVGGAIIASNLIPLIVRHVNKGQGGIHHIEVPCKVDRGQTG